MPVTHRLYLDHAATTPLLPGARAVVADALVSWANPSSPHAEGRAARAALERARHEIGMAYGWTHEVIFTSGASEAIAIGLGRTQAARVLIGATEHDAVPRAVPQAAVLPVAGTGVLDPAALAAALARPGRAIVAAQWANSETGVRQPMRSLAEAVHDAGGWLFVDAAQMPADAGAALAAHADLIAVSAHKRGGPPGIGALLVRDLAMLRPSGGQERGYRGGTENLPAALGFAAAVAEAEPIARWAMLRAELEAQLVAAGGEVVAAGQPRHPAIGAYRMPGIAATVQLIRFDLAGIAVSAGSACASGSMRPSHVLAAMGWAERQAREVIRVSFGRATSAADIERFVAAWRSIAREVGRAPRQAA